MNDTGIFIRAMMDEVWELGKNYSRGSLPSTIGILTRISYMSFGINALSEELPEELGNLTQLLALSNLGFNPLSIKRGERYTEVMWKMVLSMKVQSQFMEGITVLTVISIGSKAVPLQIFSLMVHFILSADNLHFENIELRALVV
ncbi:hypothetical protein MTR_6g007200 [Medicago truncatula]|uniref:Non-specific serine/threonine protein kinase n=1 Tax=Medicago truncatula TaxID=3880 RepID=A0A072U554_MEDTR|nr:hypothetical protein MTR_6g007200 [Medicago truncatula]